MPAFCDSSFIKLIYFKVSVLGLRGSGQPLSKTAANDNKIVFLNFIFISKSYSRLGSLYVNFTMKKDLLLFRTILFSF